jgi:hypothetical protein
MMILVVLMPIAKREMMLPYAHAHQAMLEIHLTSDGAVRLNHAPPGPVVPMRNANLMEEQLFASVQEDIQEIHILTVVWIRALPGHVQITPSVKTRVTLLYANALRHILETLT